MSDPGDFEGDDLDVLVRRVDPDRWLASRFIADPAARADVIALYAYDHELARARRAASNSLLAEIRLTWWREVLDEAYGGGPVRRHPTAQALAAAIRRRALPREALEAMIDGRIEALDDTAMNAEAAVRWADAVQGAAAFAAARILDPAVTPQAVAQGGRAWGLLLLRRSGQCGADTVDPALRRALAEARRAVRTLSVEALPAALALRLAGPELAGRELGDLGKRWRLFAGALTGRI